MGVQEHIILYTSTTGQHMCKTFLVTQHNTGVMFWAAVHWSTNIHVHAVRRDVSRVIRKECV